MPDLRNEIIRLTQRIMVSLGGEDENLTTALIDERRAVIDKLIAHRDPQVDYSEFVKQVSELDAQIVDALSQHKNEVAESISLLSRSSKALASYNKNRGEF